MNIWKKILIAAASAVVAIPVAAALVLRIPAIQNTICRKVVEVVNRSINGRLEVGSINLIPFNTLAISEIKLYESSGDTLINSKEIYLNLNELSLLANTFQINRVKLECTKVKELRRIIAVFKKDDKDTSSTRMPWDGIRVRSLIIDSLDFDLDSAHSFSDINLTLNDLFMGDGIYGTISSLSLREKSGMEIENLCTYFLADSRNAILKGFKYKDNWSDISLPIVQLKYGSFENLSHFSDSIMVQAEFNRSSFGLGSAGAFVKKLHNNRFNIFVDGKIQGKLSNFSTRNLTIRTSSSGTNIQIAAIVKGLPVPQETEINLRVNRSYTCAQDVITLVKAFSDTTKIPVLDNVDPDERLNINCQIEGNFNDFIAKLHLESNELGLLDANIKSNNQGIRRIGGEFSAENVDVGRITGSDKIGKVSAYAAGWAELKKDSLRAEIMSAEIGRLDYNGYKYCDISGGCSINKNHYKAELSSLDTNLFFKMMADFAIDQKNTRRLMGSGNFNRIDLAKLNLVQMDTCMTSFLVDFDITSTSDNNVLGKVNIQDLMAIIGHDFFDIGPVSIQSGENDDFYNATIESSLLTATYQGNDYLYGIASDAITQITSQIDHLAPIHKSKRAIKKDSYGEFSIVTGNLKPLSAILPKNIYINPGTNFTFRMNNHKEMNLSLKSELVSYEDKYVKDFDFHIQGDGGPVSLSLIADMIQSGETSIDRDSLTATIENNTVKAALSFNDRNQRFGQGNINAVLTFPDTLVSSEKIIAQILPSRLKVNMQNLDIDSSRITLFRDKKINLQNLRITNGDSFLHMDGSIGKSREDTVSVELRKFDIGGLNFLFRKNIDLKGILSGQCRAIGLMGKELSFTADFEGLGIGADGENLGDLKLLSKWDENRQQINFLLSNTIDDKKPLNVVGSWAPYTKNLSTKIDIDKFNVGWIDPLMVAVVNNSKGTASGSILIESAKGETRIKSDGLRLNALRTNVSYTKVPYVLDGPFKIDETGVYIDGMSITDANGKSGTVKGNYLFTGEKKNNIDLLFDLKNMQALNTTFQDAGQGFWGNANSTGTVRVFGPMRGLRFNIDITTEEGEVHIPLDETAKVSKRDILTFVSRRNTAKTAYDSIVQLRSVEKGVKKRRGGVKCDIHLKASSMTNLVVDINRAAGDRALVKGHGQVEMRTGEGQFDIRGSYIVHEGNCHFTILGITAKDFTIREGGVVNFVGPVLESDFKLSAAYQTKASIETLFGDTKSVSTRRTVNCVVNLTGKIDNPTIGFKIDIPDLDPSYKSMVESALSTDEKNLRQGLALLVSGGFIPDQQSGIVNNTTFLYSNASEIVSNQISNIFHQLDIPIDLGLKYQPGNSGVDIFDVAISTQLFNNRVTINGSIGNKEYATSGSNSNIIGNVDVGIKLNKTGQLKLNVFSHAADQYSNYLDQSQRNGAGVTYQEEFATFKELWDKIFKPKPKPAAQ